MKSKVPTEKSEVGNDLIELYYANYVTLSLFTSIFKKGKK